MSKISGRTGKQDASCLGYLLKFRSHRDAGLEPSIAAEGCGNVHSPSTQEHNAALTSAMALMNVAHHSTKFLTVSMLASELSCRWSCNLALERH